MNFCCLFLCEQRNLLLQIHGLSATDNLQGIVHMSCVCTMCDVSLYDLKMTPMTIIYFSQKATFNRVDVGRDQTNKHTNLADSWIDLFDQKVGNILWHCMEIYIWHVIC